MLGRIQHHLHPLVAEYLAVLGILIALLLPAIQAVRETARQIHCQTRLKELALAVHGYHVNHRVLPNPRTTPLSPSYWGWGSYVLPHVEQQNLWNQLDFKTAPTSDQNLRVLQVELPGWRCPSEPFSRLQPVSLARAAGEEATATIAHANLTRNREFAAVASWKDISDGLSQTTMLPERAVSALTESTTVSAVWSAKLIAREAGSRLLFLPDVKCTEITGPGTTAVSSYHRQGANFALADGSGRFIANSVTPEILVGLAKVRDGKPLGHF